MVTTPLDLKYVYKRGRGLERRKTLDENTTVIHIPDKSVNSDFYRHQVETYIRECSSYKDAINMLQTLYRDNEFDLLESTTQKIINDVIPTVESTELPSCISYVYQADIGEINRDRIVEAARLYKSIDRIQNNHKNLSKIFEMNFNGKSDKEKCYKVCEMVNTYKLNKNVKFNIALEELAYLGYMNGCRMPDNVLVEHVSNYFMMMDDNTANDIASYASSIEDSKIISEGADSNVKFLTRDDNLPISLFEGFLPSTYGKSKYWEDVLNEWKVDPDKSINTLVELARDNFSNINILNTILEYVEDFKSINDIDYDTMCIFTEANRAVNGDAAHNIMNVIEENNLSNADELMDNMRAIWEAELNDSVYYDGSKEPQTFTSNEIDKFDCHNMITDAQSVGEFLDQLEKTSMKESPVKIGRVAVADDKLEESNIVDYVDSNGFISMKLRSYVYEGKVDDISDLLESITNCANNMLYNSQYKVYYTLSENRFDISLRSKYKVILSEAQEIHRGFTNTDKQLICTIDDYTNSFDYLSESSIGLVMDKLMNESYAASVTPQEAALVFEVMSSYISEDTKAEFIEMCKTEANPKYESIKEAVSAVQETAYDPYVDHEEILELAMDIINLNESIIGKAIVKGASNIKKAITGDKKKNSPDESNKNKEATTNGSSDIKEKNPSNNNVNKVNKAVQDNTTDNSSGESDNYDKKAINTINDARLVWQGIKSKLKGASAKEQEMSRDLDLEFNNLLRTLKNTYGTDKREEIITGEVNHSISKIIKLAIPLVAAGIKCHNVVIPVVGAIAMFALSKHTSLKEKKLIIDEIDVELQVLEREIQRAEQSGSTKKYRQLLTIQKNIQRRRQEIYYDIARRGTRIPMKSTVGLRTRE